MNMFVRFCFDSRADQRCSALIARLSRVYIGIGLPNFIVDWRLDSWHPFHSRILSRNRSRMFDFYCSSRSDSVTDCVWSIGTGIATRKIKRSHEQLDLALP